MTRTHLAVETAYAVCIRATHLTCKEFCRQPVRCLSYPDTLIVFHDNTH